MKLYDHLAPIYDDLFPANPETINFLRGLIAEGSAHPRVVDLGSATGEHALLLAELGWELTAIEPAGLLFEQAVEKARKRSLRISSIQADMRNLEDYVDPESQDLILCLGNTLPHLDTIEEVEAFLGKAHRGLRPGGSLVLQLVNFILIGPGFIFPPIKIKNIEFRRRYFKGSKGRIDFQTELSLGEGEAMRDSTPLLPITGAQLHSALLAQGFSAIEPYSSWGREAFDEGSSRYLILVARA